MLFNNISSVQNSKFLRETNRKMIILAKTMYFHNERDPKGYLHKNLFNTGISPFYPPPKIWSLSVNSKDPDLTGVPEVLC